MTHTIAIDFGYISIFTKVFPAKRLKVKFANVLCQCHLGFGIKKVLLALRVQFGRGGSSKIFAPEPVVSYFWDFLSQVIKYKEEDI